MILRRSLPLLFWLAASWLAQAANPFLAAPDNKPHAATFQGTEWGDTVGSDELPLTTRVVTTQVAQMAWGSIFKIAFEDIVSKAPTHRVLTPFYFIATDTQIVLLNEEKPEEAIRRIAALPQPPAFAPADIYGISKGSRQHADGKLSGSKLQVNGDRSIYQWSHNSGHFTTLVWKKGAGLWEYAAGQGADADGFRLKRVSAAGKDKR